MVWDGSQFAPTCWDAALAACLCLGPADAGRTLITSCLLPFFSDRKAAQQRWMEAAAANPSRDTALLLICLQYAVACSCAWRQRLWFGWKGECGPSLVRDCQWMHQHQGGEASLIPPGQGPQWPCLLLSPSQQHTLALLISSRKGQTITCCLAFCHQITRAVGTLLAPQGEHSSPSWDVHPGKSQADAEGML